MKTPIHKSFTRKVSYQAPRIVRHALHRVLAALVLASAVPAPTHAGAVPSGFQTIATTTSYMNGVALGLGTSLPFDPTLAGTALQDITLNFSEFMNLPAIFQGAMRFLLVQRTDTLKLDLYYQVTNTSHLGPVNTPALNGADIFRLETAPVAGSGFTNDDLYVSYRTDGLAGISNANPYIVGSKPVYSADREPGALGSVAVDFDASHFINLNLGGPSTAPGNVESGETSQFLIVRTNATDPTPFLSGQANIIGVGMATVPEPGSAALLLVGLGLMCSRRARRNARA